jgi:DNA-binding NarL/FixJ family response regulator
VLLEAMASGCPVVAVAAGGIIDIVRDGVTGHLYDPGNISDAISAIRRLLSDPQWCGRVSQEARVDAEQWSWAAATRQLEGFYRNLIMREQELPREIVERSALGASVEDICEALHISRATLRRHARPQHGVVGATE